MSVLRYGPLILALLGALAFTAVGCGGGGGSTGTSSGNGLSAAVKTSVPQSTSTQVTVPAGAPTMDQKNLTFVPANLSVKVGETVYFLNSDNVIHTVNVNLKNISGNMKPGQIITWTPTSPGVYKINCDYHPAMHATITVN